MLTESVMFILTLPYYKPWVRIISLEKNVLHQGSKAAAGFLLCVDNSLGEYFDHL